MQLCNQHRLVTPHLDYLIKRRLVYRSLVKIHQCGCEIFNKMNSFEVSIELPPLILIVSSKEACCRSFMKICQHGYGVFKKMCSFEVSIGLLPLISIISSKKIPVIEVSWKSVNMELRYLAKYTVLESA